MNDVRAMRIEDVHEPRGTLDLHDHAVCLYERPEELEAALGRFIKSGLEARATSVFVHSFAHDEEAWDTVLRAYPDAAELRGSEFVLVRLYKDAFEGEAARIDYEHVGRVVTMLTEQAKEGERSGVRLFVDASRTYLTGGRADEWFAFEAWLGRRLQAAVGLVCAYRRSEAMRPDLLPRVLQTHSYRFG